jgi:DNA-binding winged helix-turn-helix (wHTH) protein
MNALDVSVFRFASFTLDMARGRLSDAAGDIALRPKSFVLLCHLARHAGHVLSKDDLIAAVWPDVTVTDDSLTQCICDLRRTLGPQGAELVRTIPRRGYMLEVVPRDRVRATGPLATECAQPGSIAVMPFTGATSMLPQDQLMFDGLVHDVISQLARLRSFDVIARGSTFALRHMADDPRRVGQTLGVAYVLCGSVMPRGGGFCLAVDLVRTDGGAIVWTDEIGLGRADIPGMIAALTDRIIASVITKITTAERHRAMQVPDQSLTAWQAYHRGLEQYAVYTESTLMQARTYFQMATQLDPGFVRAFAALSECQATLSRAMFCKDAKAEADASLRTAGHAMHLDEAAPSAQFAYAGARWLHGNHEIALVHARRSVDLSPSFADGYEEIGCIEAHQGNAEIALPHLARSEALNPASPFIDSLYITRAIAHVQLNNRDDAACWAQAAVNRQCSYPQMQATGAMVLAASGHLAKAREIVTTLRREGAVYDAMRIFKAPYSLTGPARHTLRRAVEEIGL